MGCAGRRNPRRVLLSCHRRQRITERNGNAIGYFIDRHPREGRGDRLAFTDLWRRLTYRELAAESTRFAVGLRAAGIERERRIARF
jgi:acyl-CoA synthetase (AMP-forming)/AMP-acid ligase II